jgi:hypothetical protein
MTRPRGPAWCSDTAIPGRWRRSASGDQTGAGGGACSREARTAQPMAGMKISVDAAMRARDVSAARPEDEAAAERADAAAVRADAGAVRTGAAAERAGAAGRPDLAAGQADITAGRQPGTADQRAPAGAQRDAAPAAARSGPGSWLPRTAPRAAAGSGQRGRQAKPARPATQSEPTPRIGPASDAQQDSDSNAGSPPAGKRPRPDQPPPARRRSRRRQRGK